MRVARMHLKVANGPKILPEGDSFSAGIALAGRGGIEIGLHADTEFSKRIMVGMLRLMSGEFDRTVADIEGDEGRPDWRISQYRGWDIHWELSRPRVIDFA